MGTRSVVAVPTGDYTWKGRYVHWDGYPGGVGQDLVEIIARDGVEKAIKTLTEEHYGWSQLDSDITADHEDGLGPERSDTVPGYGVAYKNDTEQPDEWITDTDLGKSWCEYVYVLMPDGTIKAYEVLSGGKTKLLALDLANDSVIIE